MAICILHIRSETLRMKRPHTNIQIKQIDFLANRLKTSRESNEWILHVNNRSIGESFDNSEVCLETFEKNKPSVVCLPEA